MAERILVADKLAEEGLEYLRQQGVDFEARVGLKEDELAAAVGAFDAMVVRSGAKVTAKVLANPGKLKAIARAGVGVDNIDLEAATAKGILVLNTAEASTLSTAEHALALMLSLARKIPQAHARDFDEFLGQLDVITFHVPGGEGTRHLLNRDRLFTKCRPNLLVVNDSRGEVVDEMALAEALKEKKIAGAALDVYATEPPAKDHPLFALDNAVLTPHLGASTDEAQTAVSLDACKAIVAYLKTGEIRGAVNAGGLRLDLPADERPFAVLAQRIGALLAAYCDAGYTTITLRASGSKAPKLMPTLLRLAVVELLTPQLDTPVNLINVEHLARARGIALATIHEPQPPAGLVGDIIGIRVESPTGESHRILGAVYADSRPRIVRFDDFAMDMIPEGNIVLIVNRDQPGVIGLVGTSFGDAQVNIADMAISREFKPDGSATALMVIKTDSPPPDSLLNRLRARPNILKVKWLALPAGA